MAFALGFTTKQLSGESLTLERRQFRHKSFGLSKGEAIEVLRDAITQAMQAMQAMQAKVEETPAIKSKMDDVAAAIGAVKRDLIAVLPKMRRAGKPDVSDLIVSLNALTPISEPLYAVA